MTVHQWSWKVSYNAIETSGKLQKFKWNLFFFFWVLGHLFSDVGLSAPTQSPTGHHPTSVQDCHQASHWHLSAPSVSYIIHNQQTFLWFRSVPAQFLVKPLAVDTGAERWQEVRTGHKQTKIEVESMLSLADEKDLIEHSHCRISKTLLKAVMISSWKG